MPRERIGWLGCDLLDLDAALGGQHEQRLLGTAVERDREVVLARDLGCLLDPETAHDVSVDVEAEDLAASSLGLAGILSASLTPPALPRPPVSTCALTTTGPPISSAAARASAGVSATRPWETGMP